MTERSVPATRPMLRGAFTALVTPFTADGDLDGRGDQALALLGREGGGLAGRAAWDQAVDAGQDLPADEPPEGCLVERGVRREGSDEGCKGAAQERARSRDWMRRGCHGRLPFRLRYGRER